MNFTLNRDFYNTMSGKEEFYFFSLPPEMQLHILKNMNIKELLSFAESYYQYNPDKTDYIYQLARVNPYQLMDSLIDNETRALKRIIPLPYELLEPMTKDNLRTQGLGRLIDR